MAAFAYHANPSGYRADYVGKIELLDGVISYHETVDTCLGEAHWSVDPISVAILTSGREKEDALCHVIADCLHRKELKRGRGARPMKVSKAVRLAVCYD